MSNSPLIAIVDDDEAMREAFRELLELAGIPCRTFASAPALLDGHLPGRFDLIVTDLKMPGMDGADLLLRLKEMGDATPSIVVTSSADPHARARAASAGARACLTKPVPQKQLLDLIGSIIGPRSRGDGRKG